MRKCHSSGVNCDAIIREPLPTLFSTVCKRSETDSAEALAKTIAEYGMQATNS